MVQSHCTAAAENHGPQHFEHRMIAAEGRVLWLRTSVRLVTCAETTELVGVMTDITDRKRAQEDADNASRAKSDLLLEIERLNGQLKRENSRMSAELEV